MKSFWNSWAATEYISPSIALQDQFVHIWRYEGGYSAIDENMRFLEGSQDYKLIMKVDTKLAQTLVHWSW